MPFLLFSALAFAFPAIFCFVMLSIETREVRQQLLDRKNAAIFWFVVNESKDFAAYIGTSVTLLLIYVVLFFLTKKVIRVANQRKGRQYSNE